jgi:hypothetical protein
MRRWLSVVLPVITVAAAAWLGVPLRDVRMKQARAIHYQQKLRSYTDLLSPGATRKQVEDALRARGIRYERVSGFDTSLVYADLVKIGTEPAPWYCSKKNVYVKFAFDAANPGLNQITDSDRDVLLSIAITPWLQDCL